MKAIVKKLLNVMVILITCSCSTTNGQVIVYRTHQPHCYTYYNGYHIFPRTQSVYTCTTRTYEIKNVYESQPQNVTNVYVNSS